MVGALDGELKFTSIITAFEILISVAYYKGAKKVVKSVFVAKLLYVLYCLLVVGSISTAFIVLGVMILRSGL